MYDFVDRPAEGLVDGSRILLWAMREWSRAVRNGICPPKVLAREFLRLGIGAALGDFHTVMVHMHRHDGPALLFARDQAEPITETEAILLGIWRDAAAQRAEEVRHLAAQLVGPPVILATVQAIERIAASLRARTMAPTGFGPAGQVPAAPRSGN